MYDIFERDGTIVTTPIYSGDIQDVTKARVCMHSWPAFDADHPVWDSEDEENAVRMERCSKCCAIRCRRMPKAPISTDQ